MKKLCVFYKDAWKWIGKQIEWIVCKECLKKLQKGQQLKPRFRVAYDECPKCGGRQSHGECPKCGYCGCSWDPVSQNDHCLAHRSK